MNKYELAKKINELEGLTNEEKSELLKLLRSQKKYGLVWEDKPEDAEQRMQEEQPVLEEVPERAIISDDPEAPNHILIEGDNLEALTALSYTHSGKIDVIYIDPPYNTGNKDFVYNDSYVDVEDSYRHSKWLSFMSKRLKLAKLLMTERGVMFISIDDNEQANIKLLCDEIFGLQNFSGQFVWQQGRKSMAAQFAINHEYCLVYCKNRLALLAYDHINANNNWREKKQGLKDIYNEYNRLVALYGKDYSLIEKGMKKFYKNLTDDNPAKGQSQYKCADDFGLYFPGDIAQGTGNGGRFDINHPVTGNPCKVPKGGWRFGEKKLPQLLSENRIHFGVDENTVPCLKRYLKETEYEVMSSVFYKDGRGATKRLETLLGEKAFDHPKDEDVIGKFIKAVTSYKDNRTYTILDFFAGSGTTLHATMQLNSEDGGHRQCILVTNNENGICENVTYERNRRVIQGYTTPKGEEVPGLTHNNLRYYKTKFVPRDKTTKNLRDLMVLSTDMLCIHNDAYTEKPFGGKNINKSLARYFENAKGTKRMLVIYNENAIPALVQLMKQVLDSEKEQWEKEKQKLMVYVFSPNGYAYDDEFEDVAESISLCAIPDAILNAYRRVLPKRKPQLLPDALAELQKEAEEAGVSEAMMESRKQDFFDFNQSDDVVKMAASEIKQNKEGGEA